MASACHQARRDGAPPLVQPGAPGEASRVITAAAATVPAVPHTAADVRFVQAMIPHHAQALDMAALVPSRSARDDVRVFARRIELSQRDEIRAMEEWLEARGATAPAAHAHQMAGMLTADEMRALADATGRAFDRLFLELMIRHHEGALAMVRTLFAEGGGQDTQIFALASEIESDQRVEIARMRRMLAQ